jgi:hypothetical protein
MLRRMVLLCGALLVGVIVLGGVALADDIRGTFGRDDLTGTPQMDRIYGLGAADTISGIAQARPCGLSFTHSVNRRTPGWSLSASTES